VDAGVYLTLSSWRKKARELLTDREIGKEGVDFWACSCYIKLSSTP
jgi:hypothetical protein